MKNATVSDLLLKFALQLGRKMNEVVRDGFVPWEEFDPTIDEIRKRIVKEFVASLPFNNQDSVKQSKETFERYVRPELISARLNNELEEKIKEGAVTEIAEVLVKEYEVLMEQGLERATFENYQDILEIKHNELKKIAGQKFAKKVDEKLSTFESGLNTLMTSIDCSRKTMELEFSSREITDDCVKLLEEIVAYSKDTSGKFNRGQFEDTLQNLEKECSKVLSQQSNQRMDGLKTLAYEVIDLMRKRNECYKIFDDIKRQEAIKFAKLVYIKKIKEKLAGAYMLPRDLEKLHKDLIREIFPEGDYSNLKVNGETLETLDVSRYQEDIDDAHNELFEEFKSWNEANRSSFQIVIGKVAGGLGFASTGAAAGAAIGLYVAPIAIVTTTTAAVATGIGAAVAAGAVIAGGAFWAYYAIRKKRRNEYLEEKKNNIEKETEGSQDPV